YLLVINADTREKDYNWARENARNFECQVEDAGDSYTQLAVQGPRAAELLQKLTDADLSKVKNYWFTHGTVCRLKEVLIARTGYTGEDGFEIYIPSEEAVSRRVWFEILETGKEMGILPCGLGARNTLRLEAKMALYGHEISDSITVWEAGLDRFCRLTPEKGSFIGRSALERQKKEGIPRTLVGLEMSGRGIARDGYRVLGPSGPAIGVVTSGSYAPFLKKNIALAYVPPAQSAIGSTVSVEIRGQPVEARIIPTPFYKRPRLAGV
ncbi:MAG: glycine cleavage system aminomethyltransferase GcvT, partial [Terriglobales bacterium]